MNDSLAHSDSPPSVRSPLYEAQHSLRYERQQLIKDYEKAYTCRLVVFIGDILADSVTPFEETLYDANPEEDCHVLLATLGGNGETAIRIANQVQSRCEKLTVIIPDQAKSAGTLLALGADCIYMGPTSDLGPIDPQVLLANGSYVAAKTIIAAVEYAEGRVQERPGTYPLYASMLNDINAQVLQWARDEINHTNDQLKKVLASSKNRCSEQVKNLAEKLKGPLIDDTQSHGASISCQLAQDIGLPVKEAKSSDSQWKAVWQLWTRYVALSPSLVYSSLRIYEGKKVSYIRKFET